MTQASSIPPPSDPASDLLAALEARLGPKGFTTDAQDMEPWLTDWRGHYHGAALALLSPQNIEEVQAVMRLAGVHKVPIVPQGGNSGMAAGATPDLSGNALLLSMRRMNSIRESDPAAGTLVAEAGVILATLHEYCDRQGRRFPLTLGGKGSATIGGLVSTNAGGTQVLRHGPMRDLVLGIEAVLPDGSLYRGLSPLKKDNRGYNLNHLLIGAEGTLAIVTAACLKTLPAISGREVAWAGAKTPQAALIALRAIDAALGNALEGFEILPASALANVLAHIPDIQAPLADHHAWHILIEAVTPPRQEEGDAVTNLLMQTISDLLESGTLDDAVIAKNEREADIFWRIRDSISESERGHGPATQHDISVPVDRMPDFLTQDVKEVEDAFPGLTLMGFGHLGDGNIHLHAQPPRDTPDRGKAWLAQYDDAISRAIYDRVLHAHGSISAEHGIGRAKRALFLALEDPARIAALKAIKQALDPDTIMNPGVLV